MTEKKNWLVGLLGLTGFTSVCLSADEYVVLADTGLLVLTVGDTAVATFNKEQWLFVVNADNGPIHWDDGKGTTNGEE